MVLRKNNRKTIGLQKRIVKGILIIGALSLLTIFILGNHGLHQLYKLKKQRTEIQNKIDQWHLSQKGETHDQEAYVGFLKEIDYLLEEGDDFTITTENVDEEIKTIAVSYTHLTPPTKA